MRKVESSLSAKVFLWVLFALTSCCCLIYALVMVVIPKQYTAVADTRIEQAVIQLAAELDGTNYTFAGKEIYNFCIANHVAAMLATGDQTIMFGSSADLEEAESMSSISVALHFSDFQQSSALTVVSSASTAGEITNTFLKLLPFAAALILLIASLSAWFCSRVIAGPVLQICNVSERMAQMDMTWRCETGRTDELGTLANSLNTLSLRLTQAMSDLEAANAQLRKDIAVSRTLEKQRRDFFAAASHELKTPITILKGQIESMALGIGDYKDHEKYLPQTLAAVERMERLIHEILAITKMESGIPETSFAREALAPVLRTCIAELEPLAEKKQIQIDVQQMSEDVILRINKRLFQKAISNVLSNAVRYSPEKQRVIIRLEKHALTIENTGVTIADDDMPLLFTPFYRADRSRNRKGGGSGLGLYIVKAVLDLHDLTYRLENAENAVRFTVFLNQN